MKEFFRKYNLIFGDKHFYLINIIISFLILSFLEAFGIGLVIPLISTVVGGYSDLELVNVNRIEYLDTLLIYLNINNGQSIVILISVVFLVKTLLAYFLNHKIIEFSFNNQKRIILNISKKYSTSSLIQIQKKQTSNVIQNLMHNTDTVILSTLIPVLRIVSESIFLIIMLVFLLYLQPYATITIIFIYTIFVLIFYKFFKNKIRQTGKLTTISRTSVIKNIQILLSAYQELQVYNKISYFFSLLKISTNFMVRNTIIYKSLNILPRYYIEATFTLLLIFSFGIFPFLGLSMFEIFSVLIIYIVAGIRMFPSTANLLSSIIQVNNSLFALNLVSKELPINIREKNIKKHRKIINPIKGINLKNVSFSFKNSKIKTINNITFNFKEKRLYVIIGKSGVGKSTFLNLISGLYLPDEGNISSNKSLNSTNHLWTQQFSYIPQNPSMFADTIISNITFGEKIDKINFKKINKILDLVELKKFTNSLPNKLNTKLGEFGNNLSGGQRQRLAIARGLYFDRNIFLFDEPTSALDDATAIKIIDLIKKISEFKTVIVSSHDKRFLKIAYKTIELNHEKIKFIK